MASQSLLGHPSMSPVLDTYSGEIEIDVAGGYVLYRADIDYWTDNTGELSIERIIGREVLSTPSQPERLGPERDITAILDVIPQKTVDDIVLFIWEWHNERLNFC